MDCPARVIEIARALLVQNPGLIQQSEDQCRFFMRLVGEQCRFELGPAYGVKSAGPGRPQGPSQIAYTGEPIFGGWRILEGAGTPSASILARPPWQAFDNQVFIGVDPIDHLHTADAPKDIPAPVPVSTVTAVQLARLYDRVDQIERTLHTIMDEWPTLLDDVAALERRRYKGRLGPFTIISTPE